MAFRKRKAQQRVERDPDSQRFRAIRDRINAKDFPGALKEINTQLSTGHSPLKKARLLALAGDTAFKRGAYQEAKEAYDSAAALSYNHPRFWLKPALASIRCNIKNGDTAFALNSAREVLSLSEQKVAAFNAAAANAQKQLQTTGQATIPIVPLRVPVIATKLGDIFLLEGEPDFAKEFYEKAIAVNPNGSCKARIGLSTLALSYDQPEIAVQRATEALLVGAFQKKTIPAWKTLIAGLRKQGPVTIPQRLLRGLNQAEPSVRARGILELVTHLRSSGSAQWRAIADIWLTRDGNKFPIIAAELRKCILSESKIGNASSASAAAALLATPLLSPQEWLGGAKATARSAFLSSDASFDVQSLIAKGVSIYGVKFQCLFTHGIALTAREHGQNDIARVLFTQAAVSAGAENQAGWSKATWALAELSDDEKDYNVSGQLWRQVATNFSVPEKFRLQALVRWAVALQKRDPTGSLEQPKAAFLAATATITQADVILDMGRQLRCSPVQWPQLQDQLIEKGERLALEEFRKASHSSKATVVLHKLARRQYYEFFRFDQLVATWKSLSTEKRLWLWSENLLFWEYISFVYKSFNAIRDHQSSEALAKFYIEDPATPPGGLVIVGAAYYEHLVTSGRRREAFEGFEWIKDEAPSRPESGIAFYWLSLKNVKIANWTAAYDLAVRAQASLKAKQGTSVEKSVDKKALLVCHSLNVDRAAQQSNYTVEELEKALLTLKTDLAYV